MYVKLKWLRKPKTTAVPIPECAWKEISFNRLIFNTTRCIKSSTSIFLRSLERFSMSYFPQYTSFSWGIKSLFSTWLYALWKTPNPSSLVATFTSDLPADSRFTLMIQFRIFAPYFFSTFSSPSKDSIGAILPFLKSNKTSERGSFLLTQPVLHFSRGNYNCSKVSQYINISCVLSCVYCK